MPERCIAAPEHSENRRWRQGIDRDALRTTLGLRIALRRPQPQPVPLHRKRMPVHGDHRAVGKRIELGAVAAFGFSIESFGLKNLVHRRSRRPQLLAGKQKRKPLGILAAALETWTVPCGKCRNLIEEEQLGIAVGPDLAVTIVEVELAANPLFRGPAPASKPTLVVMQSTAAVAHEGAACL